MGCWNRDFPHVFFHVVLELRSEIKYSKCSNSYGETNTYWWSECFSFQEYTEFLGSVAENQIKRKKKLVRFLETPHILPKPWLVVVKRKLHWDFKWNFLQRIEFLTNFTIQIFILCHSFVQFQLKLRILSENIYYI